MKKIFLTALIIFCFGQVYAQFIINTNIHPVVAPDSADLNYYNRRNPWMAGGQVIGLNVGVWGFNRFVVKEHFAYISGSTIKANLKKGFVWDNDQIGTNMFLHPYHGGLYYTAARSQGYNFWESGAFAFGGSLMWELFMENEYPSINDIVATPLGGLAVGEVLYRTSDLVLDDRLRGRRRFGTELAGLLISPTRGLTRILNGDAWKVRSTRGRQFGRPAVTLDISFGGRALELKDELFDRGTGLSTAVSIEYGDRYGVDNEKPYDYFSFVGDLNFQKRQPLLGSLNLIGRLWSLEVIDSKKDFTSIGVYQHFDYYDSDTISSVTNEIPYKFGAPVSFGVGVIHQSKRFTDWDFNSQYYLNIVALGATLSDHYFVDNRNYNIGSGLGWKVVGNIAYKNKFGASLQYGGYRLFTWKGYTKGIDLSTADERELNAQGDKSNVIFNTLSLKLEYKLRKNFYLTYITDGYSRSTRYRDFDNVRSITGESRLMLTYKFF